MSDYATATGQPETIELFGKVYKVFKLRPRDVGEMEAWFKSVTPNPKEEARKYMQGVPDAVAMHIWDRACEEARGWPPKMDSDAGRTLMIEDEGQARMIWIVLRRGFPENQFTLESARDLAERLSLDQVMSLVNLASPGDPHDPLPGSPAIETSQNTVAGMVNGTATNPTTDTTTSQPVQVTP